MVTFVENKDLIDRKAASRLLKISIRTLDRYRQAGHVTTRIVDNKILLSRSEVIEFMAGQKDKITRHDRHGKNDSMSSDNSVDKHTQNNSQVDSVDLSDPVFVETRRSPAQDISSHERETDVIETYKKMYQQVATELKSRQDELEAAHYRIGQLEGQIRYSIPLPEHKQEVQKLLQSGRQLEEQIIEKQMRLRKIRDAFYYERLNKRVYLAIVITLLLLQPLWITLIQH